MKSIPPIYQHPELDGKDFYIRGDKFTDTSLLFIHGFTATTVEVRNIAEFFHNQGFTVRAPLLPGHGTSPQDLNQKNWKDWTRTVEQAYSDLRSENSRVIVFGESLGALLTLWLASIHKEIRKIFLFSPALIIDKLWVSKLIWPFKEYVFKNYADDSMPWQGYNVVPLRAAANFFDFQQIIRQKLPTITAETFIFQGILDQTINIKSSQVVFDGLVSSRKKSLTWLHESRHVILLDKQVGEVQEKCLEEILSV